MIRENNGKLSLYLFVLTISLIFVFLSTELGRSFYNENVAPLIPELYSSNVVQLEENTVSKMSENENLSTSEEKSDSAIEGSKEEIKTILKDFESYLKTAEKEDEKDENIVYEYDDDYEELIEEVEEYDMETIEEQEKSTENLADWEKYEHVSEGQDCSAPMRFFSKSSNRPIVAISSFPGSGNTWARHLLHMASGYWTGNKRSAKPLKQAGWMAEDVDCASRTTIAQKTHRLHNNKACHFERGIVLIRNPFDAIIAEYNHHRAGKTGEPDLSVYKEKRWIEFIYQNINRWLKFHDEWFNSFNGPVKVSCFENLVHETINEVGTWLDFLDLDHRRLGCISADPVGQFYRKKTKDYSHLFAAKEAKFIHNYIDKVSKMLKRGGHEDCTKYFKYDKCC